MKKMKIQQHQFEVVRCYSYDAFLATDRRKLYEVLGLQPNATHSEIKSAYYKLSMVYHPDKSHNSEEAKIKFQEINEAYEILGNYESRRKYDRGLYSPRKVTYTETETDSTDTQSDSFRRGKMERRRPPPTGRSQIYNFDEFYRMHYGETMQRDIRRRKQYKEYVEEEKQYKKLSPFQAIVFMVIFGGIVLLVESSLSTDNPTMQSNERK